MVPRLKGDEDSSCGSPEGRMIFHSLYIMNRFLIQVLVILVMAAVLRGEEIRLTLPEAVARARVTAWTQRPLSQSCRALIGNTAHTAPTSCPRFRSPPRCLPTDVSILHT